MSGFPALPPRSSFGPTKENARPIRDPERQLGADEMNLTFWQVAGAGRVLPQALFLFDPAGPTVVIQALAFDPKIQLDKINPTVNGTGDYTWTFAVTYKDENGNNVAFTPKAAVAMVQGGNPRDEAGATVDGQTVQVEVLDSASVAVDRKVLVMVWG